VIAVPADRRALVAIDLGAESCRVSLLQWHEDRPRIQLVARFTNAVLHRTDGQHWDIEGIFDKLIDALTQCAGLVPEGIRSIAVDGWAVDYVRLDDAGHAVDQPFCYRDPRTEASQAALHRKISAERMRALTGVQVLSLNTVYQMFADAPERQRNRWLNLPEYVLYRLGARPVAERTNATHTQLMALDGTWSDEILAAVNLPLAFMPEIVSPGTDIGKVQGPIAELTAFRDTRLIAPACHDTASAIAAIPDLADDWAYISSGTWSLVGTTLRAPINSVEAAADNFTNLSGADGCICFHKNVNGMWLLRQCLETWTAAGVDFDLPALIEAASCEAPPPNVIDVDDPDLLLPGNIPARINAQFLRRGLPLYDVAPAAAPKLACLLFHSLAARYAAVLNRTSAITGKQFTRVYLMGGGSQNEFLRQLTEAATGLPVLRAGTECSTLGNFALQLTTLEHTAGPHPTSQWAALLNPLASC
jgi:rhamnulokinase